MRVIIITTSSQVKIAGIGTYLPSKRRSNYTKAEQFGYNKSFLEDKLGFKKLAKKTEDETIESMCLNAFFDLQKKNNISIEGIELLTVVTQNPTSRIPHTSAVIHNSLNLNKNCITFDISQGCSGYSHALAIVKSMMDSMNLENSLIFTCDTYSNIIDSDDRNVSMIFGDGASVTLLSREPTLKGYEIIDSTFGTLPDSNDCLGIKSNFLRMDGRKVFNYAIKEVPPSIEFLLNRNKLDKDSIGIFLLHQGSKFIIDSLSKKMKIEPNKLQFSASDYGNLVSSSLPFLLSNYFGEDSSSYIILSGFGVGFTWGTCLLHYN